MHTSKPFPVNTPYSIGIRTVELDGAKTVA